MPNFQKDPNNPKADFFNTAIGGAPKSPGGKTGKPANRLNDLKARLMVAKKNLDKKPYSK